MRINVDIEEALLVEVLRATSLKTKEEAIELGLKLLLARTKQQSIRGLRGKINWDGDLDEMRNHTTIS